MKKSILSYLISSLALSLYCQATFADVSETLHSRCMSAADYVGCINANNRYSRKSVSTSAITSDSEAESVCWWQMSWGAVNLKPAPCYVSTVSSSDSGIVFRLTEKGNGLVRTILLQSGKVSYVTLDGARYKGTWDIDSEADVWIRVTGGSFAFRLPRDIEMSSRPPASTGDPKERTPMLYETMSDTPFYWKRN